MKRYAIILATGKGTQMKSDIPKAMQKIKGKPMIDHVLNPLEDIGIARPTVIVGYQKEIIMNHLGNRVRYDIQTKQQGTAHAVLQSYESMYQKTGTTLVLNGDMPMLKKETLLQLMETHERKKALATVLTAISPDLLGYGRIIRGASGEVLRVVEEKDPNENEMSTGIFCFDNHVLFKYLPTITNENAQQEYNLTDMIDILNTQSNYKGKVYAFPTTDIHEILGGNGPVR